MADERELSPEEWDLAALLLERAHHSGKERLARGEHRFPQKFFTALNRITPSVPLELAVLNREGAIYLRYRKDKEFDGWHMPGSVVQESEALEAKLRQLAAKELLPAGIEIETDKTFFLDKAETFFGEDDQSPETEGNNPRGHAIGMLYIAFSKSDSAPVLGRFFPMDQLPYNTLGHHRNMVRKVRHWLECHGRNALSLPKSERVLEDLPPSILTPR